MILVADMDLLVSPIQLSFGFDVDGEISLNNLFFLTRSINGGQMVGFHSVISVLFSDRKMWAEDNKMKNIIWLMMLSTRHRLETAC